LLRYRRDNNGAAPKKWDVRQKGGRKKKKPPRTPFNAAKARPPAGLPAEEPSTVQDTEKAKVAVERECPPHSSALPTGDAPKPGEGLTENNPSQLPTN